MFWLTRPPYLRWAAGILIGTVAVVAEFRPPTTTPHPFAVVDIPAGTLVERADVTFRDVPVGLFDAVELPVTVSRPVAAGHPLLREPETVTSAVPDGWWALTIDLAEGITPGTSVRLALPDRTVDGIVVDRFEGSFGEQAGLVAVPSDATGAVAAAVRDGSVVVFAGR